MGPRMVHLLEQGRGRVFATVTGIAGDAAVEKSTYVLALEGVSRERLLGDPRGYVQAALSRNILKIPGHPTIARAEFIVSLCLGLDNTQLLPPFWGWGGEVQESPNSDRAPCYHGHSRLREPALLGL